MARVWKAIERWCPAFNFNEGWINHPFCRLSVSWMPKGRLQGYFSVGFFGLILRAMFLCADYGPRVPYPLRWNLRAGRGYFEFGPWRGAHD